MMYNNSFQKWLSTLNLPVVIMLEMSGLRHLNLLGHIGAGAKLGLFISAIAEITKEASVSASFK